MVALQITLVVAYETRRAVGIASAGEAVLAIELAFEVVALLLTHAITDLRCQTSRVAADVAIAAVQIACTDVALGITDLQRQRINP